MGRLASNVGDGSRRSTGRDISILFKNYRLAGVYLAMSAEDRAEVASFWLDQGALADTREAERRSREVVFMVRTRAGRLAGVSTASLKRTRDGQTYYVFRMFLRETDRTPYLMRVVTNGTRDFLRSFRHPRAEPAGMLIVTENPKLMRPGIKLYFERHGYLYRGTTPRGFDVWLADFRAARPQSA